MPGKVGDGSAAGGLHGWACHAYELDFRIESAGGPNQGGSV